VLPPDCTSADGRLRADEIRRAVEGTSAAWLTPVTVSIGVASVPEHASAGEELLEAGDVALYEAKRAGRNNRVRVLGRRSARVQEAPSGRRPAGAVAGMGRWRSAGAFRT